MIVKDGSDSNKNLKTKCGNTVIIPYLSEPPKTFSIRTIRQRAWLASIAKRLETNCSGWCRTQQKFYTM